MRYPFLLYSPKIDLQPIFQGLDGDPFIADLSSAGELLRGVDMRDQQAFQKILESRMVPQYSWGVAAYLEDRSMLLADCPQMVSEKRFIHLGLDIIVDLATPLHAPLDAVVAESGYEEGEGNYGGFVLLRHESSRYQTFYSFYGHLCRATLPQQGKRVAAGQPFAEIGDFHENGNWFYHTHLQVITQAGIDQGYISKGYCSAKDLVQMDALCPSPIPLFRPFF